MTKPGNPISLDALGEMQAMLAELEPKKKVRFTNREAVAEMAQDILRARDKLGYSIEDIAAMLQSHGLGVKPATLRGYLRDLNTAKGTAAKPKPRTGAGAKTALASKGLPAGSEAHAARDGTHQHAQINAARNHRNG